MKLTLYSPAPPITRLHELNVMFGKRLAEAGIDNEVVAVPLPDSINRLCDLPGEERALRLPIVTIADLVPAIEQTGPDWHAYSRPCPDLKLVASLYDVALGISITSALIDGPKDLAGQRVFAPARPSSVRLLTEALLSDGWGLEGEVELVDSTPLDIGPAIGRGALKATSWNITTLENDGSTTPNVRLGNERFLPVDQETFARLNERLHFKIGSCDLAGTPLLAFRQGIAVWDDTPAQIAETILGILTGGDAGPFFCDAGDLAEWPGLPDENRHPALRSLVGKG